VPAPQGSRARESEIGGGCFGNPVRAEERRQAPDQTARTSPVGALRSPRSDRPHPGRPLACRGCAAALASWQHAPESGLIGLPRPWRLARAADSGQGPHLDPGRGHPSGSAAAAARARSLWLPPSASRHFAQSSLANQDEDAQCQNSCNLQRSFITLPAAICNVHYSSKCNLQQLHEVWRVLHDLIGPMALGVMAACAWLQP